MTITSRNAICPCGSGKKYKRCCGVGDNTAKPTPSPTTLQFGQLVQEGLRRQQQGDPRTARQLFEQALALRPKEAILYGWCGMLLLDTGETDKASHIIHTGLKIEPDNALLHNYLGQVLGRRGDSQSAEQAFVRAVTLQPDLIEAWFNLGATRIDAGRPAEAAQAFQEVLARAPEHGLTHLQLAKTHYALNDVANAEQSLRRAETLGVAPGQVGLWLALVLSAQGKLDAAIEQENMAGKHFRQKQDAVGIFNELGEAELHAGRFEAAEHWLKKAIASSPDTPDSYCKLARTHKFETADKALVEKMQSLLPKATFNDKRDLEFSLGKVYSDLGDHDTAFLHYQAGNDLVRSVVASDPAVYQREADRLIETFSSERIARLLPGSESGLPILIVGAPRSGTTLAERLVCSHSQVASASESVFWSRAGKSILSDFSRDYSQATAKKTAAQYLSHLREHSAVARHIIDKMPENFWYLGLIHAMLPNARIVHCMRDPVDTCLSLYFQNLSDAHGYKWDMKSLAHWYKQYRRMMAHWRKVLPSGAIYDLIYENLVDDTEGESRKLLDFLGLEWEAGVLEFHKQESTVYTASKWQVRQQVYTSSKERWRRYEKHIGPLLELLED